MANIKSFIVPPPDDPAINHPEMFDRSSDIHRSDEEIRSIREAATSDVSQFMKHYDPKLKEYQSALEHQVKAIELIAHEAQRQSESAIKQSETVKKISVSAEKQANNSSQIAESSKVLSEIAVDKANRADVKGWLAIGISLAALGVEILSNWNSIIVFFQMLTT